MPLGVGLREVLEILLFAQQEVVRVPLLAELLVACQISHVVLQKVPLISLCEVHFVQIPLSVRRVQAH